jgi:hypothetical protein
MTRCDINIGSIDQEKFGHFLPGGLAGTMPAHLMFGLPAISISHHGHDQGMRTVAKRIRGDVRFALICLSRRNALHSTVPSVSD